MQRYHSGRTRCQVNQECEGLRLRSFRASRSVRPRYRPQDGLHAGHHRYSSEHYISSVHTSNALALNEPWSASR